MRRSDSKLFAPFKTVGIICSDVKPVVRSVINRQGRYTTILCPVGNVLMTYELKKLKLICVSDLLSGVITAVATDKKRIVVAHGNKITTLKFGRVVDESFEVKAAVKSMILIGDILVAYDVENGIIVYDFNEKQFILHLEGDAKSVITALVHPNTYLNKILVGYSNGKLRIYNIRTGKLVHEFTNDFGSAVTVLEQSPAADVFAIGLADGRVILHNIRTDEMLFHFKHEESISAVGFRTDGEMTLTTADVLGNLALWHLEKRELIGKIPNVHKAAVTMIRFLAGEPVMLTTSADNSIRSWILDSSDGMPRQLVINEGYSDDVSSVRFAGKHEVISSGRDGSVRKYNISEKAVRQKLGSAGVMSRANAKKKGVPLERIKLDPIIDIGFGWTREAAWDNVLCRHKDSNVVTTWTTRQESQGSHKLVHERFRNTPAFIDATCSSVCISPCGNYGFIGYSSGHIDQYNVQSGRLIRSFFEEPSDKEKKTKKQVELERKAHTSSVNGLSVDSRGQELVSAAASGDVKYWQIRTGACLARMQTKNRILNVTPCPVNSLLAVLCTNGKEQSVAIVDTLCRRVVRVLGDVGDSVNCLTFSADGRWLLTADGSNFVLVWELSTSQLIDVMLFEKPCLGMSFNTSGEFLATIHEGEKAIFVWANRALFNGHISLSPMAVTYRPTWNPFESVGAMASVSSFDVVTVEIGSSDDEDDDDENAEEKAPSPVKNELICYSGLPPSRWANLPDLQLIKERNKPKEAPRKPKQAPFFLTAAQTLTGFDFAPMETEQNEDEQRKILQAKRGLLEIESSFTGKLKKATTKMELLNVFDELMRMSVSAIDFQIRSLPESALPNWFRMLTEVLHTRRQFELVQSYMCASIKIHRKALWGETEQSAELTEVLEKLSKEQESVWKDYDELLIENASVVQWLKNALV